MDVRSLLLAIAALAPAVAYADKPVDLRAEIAAAIAEAHAESRAGGEIPPAHGHGEAHAEAAPKHAPAPTSAKRRGSAATTAAPKAPEGLAALEDPDAIWSALLQGNLRFVNGRPQHRDLVQLRRMLAKGQKPRAIVLSCSDSRVAPELLFDQSLGDLFVVRTAGNVADEVALGSIEYAVEHLHAPLLIVLGHEECGAVAAAASGQKMPSPYLEAVVGRIAPAIAGLSTCGQTPAAKRLRVEVNANQSASAVLEESDIVREAVEHQRLRVMTAVYGLESGVVTRIDEGALLAEGHAAHGSPAQPVTAVPPATHGFVHPY